MHLVLEVHERQDGTWGWRLLVVVETDKEESLLVAADDAASADDAEAAGSIAAKRFMEEFDMRFGAALRVAEAMEQDGMEGRAAMAYIGDDDRPGWVPVVCQVCDRRAQIPESSVPPELTQRPVTSVCADCLNRLEAEDDD